MTPEHTALVEYLDFLAGGVASSVYAKTAAAIRELAGEVERLKGMDDAMIRLALCHDIKDALVKERDTLRAENELYKGQFHPGWIDTAKECTALREQVAALKDVLHNVQHGNLCPAQPGWLDAAPCTCGLNAALADKP